MITALTAYFWPKPSHPTLTPEKNERIKIEGQTFSITKNDTLLTESKQPKNTNTNKQITYVQFSNWIDKNSNIKPETKKLILRQFSTKLFRGKIAVTNQDSKEESIYLELTNTRYYLDNEKNLLVIGSMVTFALKENAFNHNFSICNTHNSCQYRFGGKVEEFLESLPLISNRRPYF